VCCTVIFFFPNIRSSISFFLDQFPIEIYLRTFEYLWAHEILYSFHDMSVYLNNILSSYNNYLINLESIRKSHFDLICRHIRPEQVISLIMSDKIDTPNQSQLFRSFFSIDKNFTSTRTTYYQYFIRCTF
jgi:hypothetical protein